MILKKSWRQWGAASRAGDESNTAWTYKCTISIHLCASSLRGLKRAPIRNDVVIYNKLLRRLSASRLSCVFSGAFAPSKRLPTPQPALLTCGQRGSKAWSRGPSLKGEYSDPGSPLCQGGANLNVELLNLRPATVVLFQSTPCLLLQAE